MDATSRLTELADHLGTRVDELREMAAGALSDRETGHRELARVGRQVSRLEEQLTDSIGKLAERLDDLADDVAADRDQGRRTTWPRRLWWLSFGAAAGAAAAALFDPQSGRRRRNQLRDQATSTVRDLGDEAQARAKHAMGVAQGAVAETAREVFPPAPPEDPETLRQKVRSEVIGHFEGAERVVVAAHGGGRITLKGKVPSPETERQLVEAVQRVPGVSEVEDQLEADAGVK